VVNAIGVESVLAHLPTAYSADYSNAKIHNFTDSEGSHVGWFKETADKNGRVSFVSFHNAGHMVGGPSSSLSPRTDEIGTSR
jgi:carboxypeptidase C (cathepsin A)